VVCGLPQPARGRCVPQRCRRCRAACRDQRRRGQHQRRWRVQAAAGLQAAVLCNRMRCCQPSWVVDCVATVAPSPRARTQRACLCRPSPRQPLPGHRPRGSCQRAAGRQLLLHGARQLQRRLPLRVRLLLAPPLAVAAAAHPLRPSLVHLTHAYSGRRCVQAAGCQQLSAVVPSAAA